MLQIAVCGGDALVQAYLKEHINEYVEHEVCVIDGGQEALACGERYDILLIRREDEGHGAERRLFPLSPWLSGEFKGG